MWQYRKVYGEVSITHMLRLNSWNLSKNICPDRQATLKELLIEKNKKLPYKGLDKDWKEAVAIQLGFAEI